MVLSSFSLTSWSWCDGIVRNGGMNLPGILS